LETLLPNGRPVAYWIEPWGPEAKIEIERIRSRLEGAFGPDRANRIASGQRNMVIFPNLVLNDHVAITVRVFQPEGPGRMRVKAWAMGPRDEKPLLRGIRLDNFLTFLGPAGLATPDDNEMLELCQSAGFHTPLEWSDLSRGMDVSGDILTAKGSWCDEFQMRAYWAQWDRIMSGAETLSTT
jgi:p-cumate 2,3-dioxygenase alpha subunit